jgi:hypothetical protein
LQNPGKTWNRPAYSQIVRNRDKVIGRTVRNEAWRYTEWNSGKDGTELYDLKADPREQNNLEVITKMKLLISKVSGSI